MPQKKFTPDEIAYLRRSPYVVSVTEDRVSFSAEFKQLMYQQMTAGKSVRSLFEKYGIDPHVLGNRRLWGFTQYLRERADDNSHFADLRRQNRRLSF